MKEQFDNESLQAFIQGTDEGFKAIYSLYFQQISYFTYKLINHKQESEDITAITFVKLFKLHHNFTTFNNIRAFLYITARNTCLDYLRSLKRRKTFSKDFSEMDIREASWLENELDLHLENEMIQSTVLKQIYEAVDKLPDQCQRIFKMLFFQGMKTADIARELNITPETVRSQKRRALDLLRLRLSDNQMALAIILYLSLIECGHLFHQVEQC
jgi:RNA polymerase sigma-70 factor (ECF subfamily)